MSHPIPGRPTLYDPRFEQDACGVGFLARPSAQPSHDIVEMALDAVVNLAHRGALDADARTGDGAGILVQVPRRFMAREAQKLGLRLREDDPLGVAMVFLPRDELKARRCRGVLEAAAVSRGLQVLGWRRVPVDSSTLGDKAAGTRPQTWQMLVVPPQALRGDDYERAL